ncbi:MAG: hypothetical protein WD992_01810 [Candidatus Levyibacteriota bacterium]
MAVDEQSEDQQPAANPPKGLEGFDPGQISRLEALQKAPPQDQINEDRARFDYNPNADAVEQALKEATRQKEDEALKEQALKARSEVSEALNRDVKTSAPYSYHENGITVDRSKFSVSRSLVLKDKKDESSGQLDVDLVYQRHEGEWQPHQLIMRQNTVEYQDTEPDTRKMSMAGMVIIEPDGNFTVRRIFSDFSSGEVDEDISYTTKPTEDGKIPENTMTAKLASAWIKAVSQRYTKSVPPAPTTPGR